jgi:S-adenosylmethionine decarboxylase
VLEEHVAPVTPVMRLWALDARVRDPAVLTDEDRLRRLMYEAAHAARVSVLGEEFCVFDNSAVTGVLVLAQSHLSIHTWPEFSLVNIDLLTYGDVGGEEVVRAIGDGLGADRVTVTCVHRGAL